MRKHTSVRLKPFIAVKCGSKACQRLPEAIEKGGLLE
jgi:hypothetical protein